MADAERAEERVCIGFGSRTGRCGEPPDYDLNSSGLWCTECERARREHITAQMAAITASFEEAPGG